MTANDKNAWVEELLIANPLTVDDDGFSKKVLAEIDTFQTRRLFILAPFFVAGIAALLAFFPYKIFNTLGLSLTVDYSTLVPAMVPTLMVLGMVLFFSLVEESA